MNSSDDHNVWVLYTKKVKPVKQKRKTRLKQITSDKPEKPLAKVATPQNINPETLPATGSNLSQEQERRALSSDQIRAIQFDKRTERALRQGAITLDGKIDLHGLFQSEAHEVLLKFIEVHVKKGSKHLLVITGKGRPSPGVLRTKFADWLYNSPFRPQILSIRQAALRHGGEGAFYVILRRKKDAEM